ncbi:MAG: carbohydrate kinase [Gammaproteobacteria bacterium]|nr:carbohydrate kinase [Gammaproteobacteria bacterium]MBU1655494.1 carbohydrate kinase [Gammaproteobacteria bacterium]MBU1961695.1 carbohydrate kinase [Gammaproteobacteria bacterium]
MNRPILFGEVLFDQFPDGSRVLGGAPFNVAWHLQAFGANPLLISRVGVDIEGDEITGAMAAWGMDLSGIQRDLDHATGAVQVSLAGGEPRFEILANQAYDFIDPAQLPPIKEGALLYHGSLALRNQVSRTALDALLASGTPVFLDVNLRPPWWDRARLDDLLKGARWVKLNQDELMELEGEEGNLEQKARRFLDRQGLEALFLTQGKAGALALSAKGDRIEARPQAVAEVVDTVGAGDAFASVLILGLIRGWGLADSLRRAQSFAASLVAVRGATVSDRAFYETHLAAWNAEGSSV